MKLFTKIAAVLFLILSLVHIFRLAAHWDVIVNGFTIPQWVSIPGFLVTAILALMLWKEAKQ
jgi:hypothetical protein